LNKAQALFEGTYGTQLAAYVTANAQCAVDGGLAVLDGDGRAADPHTGFAANTLVSINVKRRIMLNILKKSAGAS